jgi:hypothetical protein
MTAERIEIKGLEINRFQFFAGSFSTAVVTYINAQLGS